jgi:D-beta-D-heptose 7-phosphate kinase/D-beta-D-heptose 1-phosphate adenosyltransferase
MPKILVVGDLMVDSYLWGSCEKISPEAPVQVVNIEKENQSLGGAGNVINNLYSLGAEVGVISVIGECKTSKDLQDLLLKINIDTKYLFTEEARITTKKTRIIASQQQVIRYDFESSNEITIKSQTLILNAFKSIYKDYDLVILSDYGKGVLTLDVTKKIIQLCNSLKIRVLVDPKGYDYSKYTGAYLLTPNKKEASQATNIKIVDRESLSDAVKYLKKICSLEVSLITLSEEGVVIYDNELRIHPTSSREVYDVTGAGDTIIAAIGYALSCNNSIDEAVKFANIAAGVVIGKIGSATATIDEINEYDSRQKASLNFNNIKSHTEISKIVKELKIKNKKIVFTNGCFDILHSGHIKYLEKAKSYGDILILGINSDRSVRKLKGENRPINNQNDRAYVLASLEFVDYVVIFDDDTPISLIKLIHPEILVKGGDYKGKDVVGQDIAKELILVDYIENKSTTETIKRIKNL